MATFGGHGVTFTLTATIEVVEHSTFSVTVPAGQPDGAMLQATSPDGQAVQFQVPAGSAMASVDIQVGYTPLANLPNGPYCNKTDVLGCMVDVFIAQGHTSDHVTMALQQYMARLPENSPENTNKCTMSIQSSTFKGGALGASMAVNDGDVIEYTIKKQFKEQCSIL